jgi:hypothetical protein
MWYASPEFVFVVQQITMLKRFRKMGWREAKTPKLGVHNHNTNDKLASANASIATW